MARKAMSRRRFVGDVGAGVAFTIVPRHVLGRGFQAPSDTLSIACIGVGGMGATDVRGVGKTENIYALCDVDDRQAAASAAAFPKAKRFKDFRVMLEKEGKHIDAVMVSTPDHTHAVAAVMAMKMGKHTRVQKPLARTLWEVRQLEQAARRYKVATQMGNPLDPARQAELTAHPPAQKYPRTEGVYPEWIAACKGGPAAGSTFAEHAGPLTEVVLLGNLAVRIGRTLEINPQTGEVTNTTIPEDYIRPQYRAGWSL